MKDTRIRTVSGFAIPWLLATIAVVGGSASEVRAQFTPGACCFPDGSCDLVLSSFCSLNGGTFVGGSTCAGVVCTGACCLPNGDCDDLTTSLACQGVNGGFRGRATVCADQVCGGACCAEDGTCRISEPGSCLSVEVFHGLGSLCEDVTCSGACCERNGTCRISNALACLPFEVFHGLGSDCPDVDCAGACCLPDGDCLETSEIDCIGALEGTFLGLEAVCEDAVCTGACCLPNKGCADTGPGTCAELLGVFQGRGAVCGDDCPTPMPSAFTYQGRLQQSGRPFTGLIDGHFSLWLSPESQDPANQIGFTIFRNAIEVENGLFSLELDFGQDSFNGNARWLQIEIRHHNDENPEAFTPLAPRQSLTPAPYALQTRGIVVRGNGNVGIGTKTPSAPLHVSGSENNGLTATLKLTTANGQQMLLDGNEIDALTDDLYLNLNSSQDVILATGGGNVGIGTSGPAARLDVHGGENEGPSSAATLRLVSTNNFVTQQMLFDGNEIDATTDGLFLNNNTSEKVVLANGGGNVGIGDPTPGARLAVVGDITYTGTISDVSDERLKENIAPVRCALDKVRQLQGVYFNMKDTPGKRDVGLLAQNVQDVLPEAVRIVEPETGYLGVSYASLVPLLIEAIKETQTQFTRCDPAGIHATVAIQELHALVQDKTCEIDEFVERERSKDQRIGELAEQNAELLARVARLEGLLEAFVRTKGATGSQE